MPKCCGSHRCAAYSIGTGAKNASLASEDTDFGARRGGGQERARRGDLVLLQADRHHGLVPARLSLPEEVRQPGRERFLVRVLRNVTLIGCNSRSVGDL